jgi:hypothetical protein
MANDLRQLTLFALLICGLLGAGSPVAANERATSESFVEAFNAAFSEHDPAQAVALFYWDGVTTGDKQRIVTLVERDLGFELLRTAWLPPSEGNLFQSSGGLLRSNLETIARLAVEFRAPDGTKRVSVHDVGVHEGIYYIALAEPVPASAKVWKQPCPATTTSSLAPALQAVCSPTA